MKNTLSLLFSLLFLACVVSGQSVAEKDLKVLEGGTWTGTLTYLDYGSGKKTEIKSNLNVVKKSDDVWTFAYVYPDEPKANGSSEVLLADGGKTFNGQAVTSKLRQNGTLQIVTTKDGVEIFYKDWGSGQPIMFHHGWPLSADDWAHIRNKRIGFVFQGFNLLSRTTADAVACCMRSNVT